MDDKQQSPRHKGSMTGTQKWIRMAVLAVVIWIGFLISWILFEGSDIGTPSTASSAFIVANERLLQMVQWTIATILTLGGALIGLNWYQSEKRYQDDKKSVDETLAQVQSLVDGLEERFNVLANSSFTSLVGLAMQQIEAQARAESSPLRPTAHAYIKIFRNSDENLIRKHAALQLIIIEGLDLKSKDRLTESEAQPFKHIYDEAVAFDAYKASQLAWLLLGK